MLEKTGSVPQRTGAEPPTVGSEILLAEDLQMFYGSRAALRSLSFTLERGRVLGFLGPNGAGKTTAIRILTTTLKPSSGRFAVGGISSEHPERIRAIIGVLPENLGLPQRTTAVEYLTFFAQLYGRTTVAARQRSLQLLEELDLRDRANTLIATFSHGMRQRLGIARALINDPVVVFLDEPTLGLDPRGQQRLLSLIRRIALDRNAGVVLCSHVLSEIEGVCDDVVILNAGSVVAAGSVDDVVRRGRADDELRAVRVRVPARCIEKAEHVLRSVPAVVSATAATGVSGWLNVELTRAPPLPLTSDHVADNRVLEALVQAGIQVVGYEALSGRLLDAFLRLTEEAAE